MGVTEGAYEEGIGDGEGVGSTDGMGVLVGYKDGMKVDVGIGDGFTL